jgi:Mg-chelatase subunit ChlD
MKVVAFSFAVAASSISRLVSTQAYPDVIVHRRSLVSEVDNQMYIVSDNFKTSKSAGEKNKAGKSKAGDVYSAAKGGKTESGLSLFPFAEGKSSKASSSKSQKATKQHSSKASSKAGKIAHGGEGASPPTPKPTCSDGKQQENKLNVCFALDTSGSLCNNGEWGDCIGWDGSPCESVCRDENFPESTCCGNFATVRDFSSSIVTSLEVIASGTKFSVVQFANNAKIACELSPADQTLSALSELVYSGGTTNHESAIQSCQVTFADEDENNIILLITDGVSTSPSINPQERAEEAAASAKEKGTTIIPIFISTNSEDSSDLDFMSRLSSTGEVVEVSGFDGLASIQNSLVTEVVAC